MKINKSRPSREIREVVKEVLNLPGASKVLTASTVNYYKGGFFRVDYLRLHPLMRPMRVPTDAPIINSKELINMVGAIQEIYKNSANALTKMMLNANKANNKP